jgi:superfamily II DNA or RNA helicase
MRVIVTNKARLEPTSSPERESLREVCRRLTFPNPTWLENDKRGFWNGATPRELCFARWDGNALVIPRGFTEQAKALLGRAGISVTLGDRRRVLPEADFTFTGTLRDYQQEAIDAMLKRGFGVLEAPTGSGKTVMALACIAARKQPALIVVHTTELLHQWVARIETFLGIPAGEVGIIGTGKQQAGERITVALIQSLYKCASEVSQHIGHLIVDECHRAPSRTFTEAVSAFDCKYMLGLSATPWRRDGLSRLLWWHLGDKVHAVPRQDLVEHGQILVADVVFRDTDFTTNLDASEKYSLVLSFLTQDHHRNTLIAQDVAHEALNGSGVCLVLSDRKSHCQTLTELLEGMGTDVAMLTGDTAAAERKRIVEAVNAGSIRVLVATGQLIGEGFDCKRLSTLFITTPVKFDGRVIQYLGRILRPAPGKARPKVFDYVDHQVGVLHASARGRARVYQGMAA